MFLFLIFTFIGQHLIFSFVVFNDAHICRGAGGGGHYGKKRMLDLLEQGSYRVVNYLT